MDRPIVSCTPRFSIAAPVALFCTHLLLGTQRFRARVRGCWRDLPGFDPVVRLYPWPRLLFAPLRFWHATLCRKDCRRIDRYWWAAGLSDDEPEAMTQHDAREPILQRSHLLMPFCRTVILSRSEYQRSAHQRPDPPPPRECVPTHPRQRSGHRRFALSRGRE